MVRVVKALIRVWREGERPWREWWVGLGTVDEALEELES
jgi:hypothetical protein